MRFLVIDRDANQRLSISRELQREFANVEVVEIVNTTNFEQALAAGNFDLTVIGYPLHWGDGLEIVRSLKNCYPDRPVIMITDVGNQEVAIAAMKNGMDDYLLKSSQGCLHLWGSVQAALTRTPEPPKTATLKEQLPLLLEQFNIGVFQMLPGDAATVGTASNRILEANDAFLRILGVSSLEEVQTSEFYQLLSQQQDLIPGQQQRRELLLHHQGGAPFWVVLSETLTRIEGITVIVGLLEDITPRKQTEGSLRRYAARLATLRQLDSSILQNLSPAEIAHLALQATAPIIQCQLLDITVFDSELQEVTVLAAQTRDGIRLSSGERFSFQEYGAIEQLRQNQAVVIDDLTAIDHLSPLLQQFAAQGIRSIARLPIRAQNELIGSLKLAATQPHAFTQEDIDIAQELVNQMAIAIQQSRLKEELQRYADQLEQEVHRRTQELETTNSDLESFVYSVSHDLREPLRAIQSYTQILLEDHVDHLDSEGTICTQRIAENAARMNTLIRDLLTYSRLGRVKLSFQAVDLNQLLREVLSQLQLELQQSQAQVTVDSPLPMVKGHYATLLQVIANLLINAIKFVRPGVQPQIRIWAEEVEAVRADGEVREVREDFFPTSSPSQRVRLWIEDNGIGIDPQYHDRIFQVFERLHSLETYPGTGIGLAIVQKGVEHMGGRVGVESESEQGSRFWLELPAIDLHL